MYTNRPQPFTPVDNLGLVPAFAVSMIPAVSDWLGGHSSLYTATVAAIPVYKTQALAGDVCAYMVLKSWSGDQVFCRYAIDHCHDYYLGTKIGQAGPCGAADASSKAAALAAWQAVDTQRPDVATAARTVLAGGPMPTPPASASGSSGGGLILPNPTIPSTMPAIAGFPISTLAIGVVALVFFSMMMRNERGTR